MAVQHSPGLALTMHSTPTSVVCVSARVSVSKVQSNREPSLPLQDTECSTTGSRLIPRLVVSLNEITSVEYNNNQKRTVSSGNGQTTHVHVTGNELRLLDTGCMDTRRCAHNRLKMYCEQLAKNCSTIYYFSHTI